MVPVGPAPNDYSPPPVGAVIYRWDGQRWAVDGRLPRLRHHLDVNGLGGWFISVPTGRRSSVAFELVGSCCGASSRGAHSTGLISNAGGKWHVVPLR